MKVKYCEERKRADGSTAFIFNPPTYVKAATGAVYTLFPTRTEAHAHANAIAAEYWDYKAKSRSDIYLDENTVEGLMAHYRTTEAWKVLADNSKRSYDFMMRSSCAVRVGQSNINFGHMLAKNVTVELADKFKDTVLKSKGRHRANACCKVMRRVFNVALRHSRVKSNPFIMMNLKATPARKVLWEDEHIDAFLAKADEIGRSSIGTIALLCYEMCQRPGDMRQLKWGNYKRGVFTFTQEKTKVDMKIDATPSIIDRLDKLERGVDHQFIIMDETGLHVGYDRFKYYKLAREIIKAAGLPEYLQLRDLRRTGATELAEHGCTEDELRSITGHQGRDILNTYIRPTHKMARNAMKKRFG